MQFNRRWKFGWGRFSEVDLFTDRHESNAETLSQAIRAAASEEPDADGSVLFGQLKGTVVGLRYYSGVVRISQGLFYSSSGQRRQHRSETCGETWKAKGVFISGQVNQGEMVGLVRQPQNPYDRNAVMVANIYGNQVGHIKKELAAAMAYIMDNNLAKVEGWAAMCPKLLSLSENRTITTWTPKQKHSGVADH